MKTKEYTRRAIDKFQSQHMKQKKNTLKKFICIMMGKQRTNYLKENTIAVLKKDEYDFCKRGFFGGRTEVFQMHKKFNK